MDLQALGWDERFAAHFAAFAARGLVPGRVIVEHQHLYDVATAEGERLARVAGRLRHRARRRDEFPAVGDWVALRLGRGEDEATIQAILPRVSRFSRKVAGDVTEEQVVAANIDTVFLVSGLDGEFNARRLERYLVTAREGGATPVVVLNKADLADDAADAIRKAEASAPGVAVHAVSGRTGAGLDQLAPYLAPGRTVALLGTSGVGKSTIINRLLGQEIQRTHEVRLADRRGRHTTVRRELFVLPAGGLLIDTPGMRELQLWEGAAALERAFDEIHALADGCHFRDCRHQGEPRCAVQAAVDAGRLPASRLEHYRQLQRELAFVATRQDRRAELEQKRTWKIIHKAARQHRPRE